MYQRPPEIELIRQMARPKLPKHLEELLEDPKPIEHPQLMKDIVEIEEAERFEDPEPCDHNYDDEGGFIIKPAGTWLHKKNLAPESKMLFGKFWFQNELCILFADTNAGKSILAVQIGDAISRGQGVANFEMTAPPQTVLYFDFELSAGQFQQRYTSGSGGNADHNNPFTKRFLRAVFNPASNKARKFGTFEAFINNELENAIITSKAKVLIIDNVTCLRYGAQATSGALNLVRYLQGIKNTYNLSILLLAHTPKRNPARPISRNDLAGSKMLINFCDSAFAIGESQSEPGQRYLKQIKQRSAREEYGAENVCLCSIVKQHNFIRFQFGGQAHEAEHLARYNEPYRRMMETRIAALTRKGLSIRRVAAKLNTSTATVCRTLQNLKMKEDDLKMDEEDNLKMGEFENLKTEECAGVKKTKCADVQICGCADEEKSGFECADVQICGCADEEKSRDLCDSLPGEGREGFIRHAPRYVPLADEEKSGFECADEEKSRDRCDSRQPTGRDGGPFMPHNHIVIAGNSLSRTHFGKATSELCQSNRQMIGVEPNTIIKSTHIPAVGKSNAPCDSLPAP